MTYDEFADATDLLPSVIADGITEDRTEADWLVTKLLTICTHNRLFFAKCKRTSGRDMVRDFMHHWHTARRLRPSLTEN